MYFYGANTWYNANSSSFKCHSISMTFKFFAVLDALCVPEPRSTDSLGTQHCANFESHSNRVTFETTAISITSSIHALFVLSSCKILVFSLFHKSCWLVYFCYSFQQLILKMLQFWDFVKTMKQIIKQKHFILGQFWLKIWMILVFVFVIMSSFSMTVGVLVW